MSFCLGFKTISSSLAGSDPEFDNIIFLFSSEDFSEESSNLYCESEFLFESEAKINFYNLVKVSSRGHCHFLLLLFQCLLQRTFQTNCRYLSQYFFSDFE